MSPKIYADIKNILASPLTYYRPSVTSGLATVLRCYGAQQLPGLRLQWADRRFYYDCQPAVEGFGRKIIAYGFFYNHDGLWPPEIINGNNICTHTSPLSMAFTTEWSRSEHVG